MTHESVSCPGMCDTAVRRCETPRVTKRLLQRLNPRAGGSFERVAVP